MDSGNIALENEGLDIELLKTIMQLTPEFRFFIWLYLPLSIIEIDDTISVHKKTNLSDFIFLRKLIMHCVYQSMDLDATIDFLFEKGLIEKNIEDLLIVEETFNSPINFNTLDKNIVNKIIGFAHVFYKRYNSTKTVEHNHYPMVHEQRGRPMLGWVKCFHRDCEFKGGNADALREHLINCKAYTAYFHKTHETTVESMKLTPEKIKKDGIVKCPSPICDKSDKIESRDELIQHLKRLGIPPFWKQGDVIDYSSEIDNKFDVIKDKPIYSSDDCVVCLDNHASILFLDCNHHVVCMKCLEKLKDCPMCGGSITLPIGY